MISPRARYSLLIAATLSAFAESLAAAEKQAAPRAPSQSYPTVTRTNYHGWADSWVLSNGKVEAVIVPVVDRVMQFRFVGDADGPFWENRAMDGKQPDPNATEWGNFGGDKTWPAPQDDWPKVTNRSWPPPPAFDSMPVKVQADGAGVSLVSLVDTFYGTRTIRIVTLDATKPEMTIDTTYEKVTGPPQKVAIWTITQLKDPIGVFLSPSPSAPWPSGYYKQSDRLPADLKRNGQLLSLTRDLQEAHKIGSQANSLVWVGEKQALKIFNALLPNAEYPDQGCNAEVYTNPDPLQYVELEMLGPLHEMRVGDKIRETQNYTLIRRENSGAEAEARRILGARAD